MRIQLKLFATLEQYLPPGGEGRYRDLDLPEGTRAHSLLAQLGVPVGEPGAIVVLVNGHHCAPDQVLQEGDVLSAFPAMAGG